MRRVDLHNHTTLCNHAKDSMQEYVLQAIELGIDEFGFSDHAPMNFDPKYRMDRSQKKFYEDEVHRLQQKYQDIITIRLGYEVDFMDEKYMYKEILDAKVDYLIGSVHFLGSWGFDNPEFMSEYKKRDIDTVWREYFKAITKMAQSGYFHIVGHLDLLKVFRFLPTEPMQILAKEAIEAIKKANMVVEINPAGLRKPIQETYPSKELLQLCFEQGIGITFGSDAHSAAQVGFGYEDGVQLAKEIGYDRFYSFENKKAIAHSIP